ncbi:hypothetical protein NECAME_12392 [Necator americanus]|uniref:Uncharacterized protein n=1 Tax=Necator americanus TaxID=51031 RepID=W2T0A1_NECAM|nr:hypothetical protein NECAME_12392 [Necator americanus]ETN75435.1 hypothetical protein NECAME_12392 [Necator americanus]
MHATVIIAVGGVGGHVVDERVWRAGDAAETSPLRIRPQSSAPQSRESRSATVDTAPSPPLHTTSAPLPCFSDHGLSVVGSGCDESPLVAVAPRTLYGAADYRSPMPYHAVERRSVPAHSRHRFSAVSGDPWSASLLFRDKASFLWEREVHDDAAVIYTLEDPSLK